MSTINIDVLIRQITSKLNIDEDIARRAIGLILSFVQKTCSKNNFDFSQILQKLQGAETLISRSRDPLSNQSSLGGGEGPTDVVGNMIALITWFLRAGFVVEVLKRILSIFFGEKAAQMIDSAGDGTELIGKLNTIGVTQEQGTKVISMLISFLKQNLDPKTIDELLEKMSSLILIGDETRKKEE